MADNNQHNDELHLSHFTVDVALCPYQQEKMETYKINIRFRERNIAGYVQKFSDHFDVFFQDEEILLAMGGLISFDANKKLRSARETKLDDAGKFYKVVAEHLI